MYLSYTGYKTYTSCPRMYLFRYVQKPKLEVLENRVNSLFGTIIGNIFEAFYNEKLWAGNPGVAIVEKRLLDRVMTSYLKAVAKETRDGVILWKPDDSKANYASMEDLLEDVREAVPRGLRVIRHHRLLDRDALAEVKLDQDHEGHTIGGRCDIRMRRIEPHHDLILLDGKGSKWRDKYVDTRQLKWYAMLHRMKYGHMPDRLGFVFWRFEPDKGLDWVECSLNELDDLLISALTSIREIEDGQAQLAANPSSLPQAFPAHPGDGCRFCAYMPLCPEGTKFNTIKAPEHVGTGVEDVGL
jgi:hypothetical protein